MAKCIGTHNGIFHADEALACFMLKQLPQYKDAKIIRTRDIGILDKCDIVVDVGTVFDPASHRYDHHQRTFNHSMKSLNKLNFETKLSSAGLVYAYFGEEIIKTLAQGKLDNVSLKKVFEKIYETLIEEIDGIDNGIEAYTGDRRYRISTTLSSRVSRIFPCWNEPQPKSEAEIDEMFTLRAMPLVGAEFMDRFNYLVNSWLPARDIVEKAYNERKSIHESGHIMLLPNGGVPWKEHLFKIEENDVGPKVIYTLFEDRNGTWRVQAVPICSESFNTRHPLFADWQGLRSEELIQKSGIEDIVFVHSTGFIGGAQSIDGVMKMATKSLENYKE